MKINFLDFSFSRFPAAEWDTWPDTIGFAQCGWTGQSSPTVCHDNIVDGVSRGKHATLYTVVNERTGREAVDRAIEAAGNNPDLLSGLWIDIEVSTTEQIILDALDYAEQLGFKRAGYTAAWFWNYFGLSLGHFPQTNAAIGYAKYDGVPEVGDAGLTGWNETVWHQFQGTTTVNGIDVDLGVIDPAFFAPPPPPPLPTEVSLLNLLQVIDPNNADHPIYVVGELGARHLTTIQEVDLYMKAGYGLVQVPSDEFGVSGIPQMFAPGASVDPAVFAKAEIDELVRRLGN